MYNKDLCFVYIMSANHWDLTLRDVALEMNRAVQASVVETPGVWVANHRRGIGLCLILVALIATGILAIYRDAQRLFAS